MRVSPGPPTMNLSRYEMPILDPEHHFAEWKAPISTIRSCLDNRPTNEIPEMVNTYISSFCPFPARNSSLSASKQFWKILKNFEKMEKNGTRQEKSTLRSRNSHLKEVDEVTSNIKSPAPSSSLLTNYTLPNKRGNFRPQKKTSRRHLLCLSPLKQQAGLHISWPKYLIHDTLTPIIVAIPPSASLV